MTDPTTLTKEQLIQYVLQLQHTVKHWQSRYAEAKGMTWDEYLEKQHFERHITALFNQKFSV